MPEFLGAACHALWNSNNNVINFVDQDGLIQYSPVTFNIETFLDLIDSLQCQTCNWPRESPFGDPASSPKFCYRKLFSNHWHQTLDRTGFQITHKTADEIVPHQRSAYETFINALPALPGIIGPVQDDWTMYDNMVTDFEDLAIQN